MRIPDHVTCLLRNLYAGQEATDQTRHGTMDWLKIGKGVHQGYILSPCLFGDPTDVGNLISGSSGFSKSNLNIWKFPVHLLSKVWRILSIILLVCEVSAIMQQFEHSLALPFLGIEMKTNLFQSCSHGWVFQICWPIECTTFTALSLGFERAQLEFHHLH